MTLYCARDFSVDDIETIRRLTDELYRQNVLKMDLTALNARLLVVQSGHTSPFGKYAVPKSAQHQR